MASSGSTRSRSQAIVSGTARLALGGETGRSGAQFFFELDADEVEDVTILLRDDRGAVEGFVRRQKTDGTVVPVEGAVVYAHGTPDIKRSWPTS